MPATKPKAKGKAKGKAAPGKKSVAASAAPEAVPQPDDGRDIDVNANYKSFVTADLKVILGKYPTLKDQAPLPMLGTDGFKGLSGHGAPFADDAYDAKYAAFQDYTCNINVFQHALLECSLPFVPLYRERVLEYGASNLARPSNVLNNSPLVLEMKFANADNIVHGDQTRLSPDEPIHALLHIVASRIQDNAPQSELDEWVRAMLSYPTAFKRVPGDTSEAMSDFRYAEANSLRLDAISTARTVGLTARQLIHNIVGFKKQQEQNYHSAFGAGAIAKFWEEKVRLSKETEMMAKKSTIDLCLTIDSRLLSLPGIESMIAENEALHGPASWFNSLYRLQEVVSRGGGSSNIDWFIRSLLDGFAAETINPSDVSVNALKSGGKNSISDVILTSFSMKKYLLGKWLTEADIPSFMKERLREIFQSHETFRRLWHPFSSESQTIDTTWLFSWPKAGRELVDFFELCIFLCGAEEEKAYRAAVKNSLTPAEILKESPFKEKLQVIMDGFRVCCRDQHNSGAEGSGAASGTGTDAVDGNTAPAEKTEAEKLAESSAILVNATNRIMTHQGVYINDQPSIPGLIQEFENQPLACVKASAETGNVLVLIDCNTWGETDHRPRTRLCPIGKDKIEDKIKAVMAARQGRGSGGGAPDCIQTGDIYVCIDGGKNRFRQFSKHLKIGDGRSRNVKRTIFKKATLTITERSWRARRHRNKGHAKLTQGVYIAASQATWSAIKAVQFETINGSTRSDSIGPINLDPVSEIPSLPQNKKKEYYGKRWALAGGRLDEDSSEAGEDDDDSGDDGDDTNTGNQVVEPEKVDPPISYHCLPITFVVNLAQAYNCKHIVDLTPTPLPLAYNMVRTGGSYCGVAYSPLMHTMLKKQLFDKTIRGIVDHKERLLYDPRFKSQAAEIGIKVDDEPSKKGTEKDETKGEDDEEKPGGNKEEEEGQPLKKKSKGKKEKETEGEGSSSAADLEKMLADARATMAGTTLPS